MGYRGIQAQVTSDAQLRDALAANRKRTDKVIVEGKEVTIGEVLTMLGARIDNVHATEAARAALHDAATAKWSYLAETDPVIDGLRAQLAAQLAPSERPVYGVAKRKKPAPRAFDARVVSVHKLRATRAGQDASATAVPAQGGLPPKTTQ